VASPLTLLQQRATEDWFIGDRADRFNLLADERFRQLQQRQFPATILLAESDPIDFLASFLAAIASGCSLFLGNPRWQQQEWQEVLEIAQPDLVWGNIPSLHHVPHPSHPSPLSSSILIPTGGSSGKLRFAIHTWDTLNASVEGFYGYFGSQPVNSFCTLPLYHVSGLMQFLRSFLTGGRLLIWPYKFLKEGDRGPIHPEDFFISLVPTQLQFLLDTAPVWLSRFRTVLVGGAPIWPDLRDRARKHQIKLAPTYGMTETAAQVVTLQPQDFLAGNNSSGRVLPHAEVTVENERENIWESDRIGTIYIRSNSLCFGYYPETSQSELSQNNRFSTDDLGYFDSQGYLHVVGRSSTKIITGGENVFPAEVEAAILSTQLVSDVCTIGVGDRVWGEAIFAVYTSQQLNLSPAILKAALESKLSSFKIPKYWLQVEKLPRNERGKINYSEVEKLALQLLI